MCKVLVAATMLRCVVYERQLTDIDWAIDCSAVAVTDAETLERLGGLRKANAESRVVMIVREAFEEDAEIKAALAGDGLDLGS
jgi:hypothetical protein